MKAAQFLPANPALPGDMYSRRFMMFFPPLFMFVLAISLLSPTTVNWTVWLLSENRPIELLSSLFALWAAVEGWRLIQQLGPQEGWLVRSFLLLFTSMMFFLGMEEISWGQQLLDFSTPEFWRVRNAQGELTLHNYDFAGERYLELYPFLFGVGGLIGIGLRAFRWVPATICPPVYLWPWFATVVLHCGLDLSHEFYIASGTLDEIVNHLDEAAELLVASSGLLFLAHNRAERE